MWLITFRRLKETVGSFFWGGGKEKMANKTDTKIPQSRTSSGQDLVKILGTQKREQNQLFRLLLLFCVIFC